MRNYIITHAIWTQVNAGLHCHVVNSFPAGCGITLSFVQFITLGEGLSFIQLIPLVAGYHVSFIHFISLGEGYSQFQVKAEYLMSIFMVLHFSWCSISCKGMHCMVFNTVDTVTYYSSVAFRCIIYVMAMPHHVDNPNQIQTKAN